jgi:hypothetical protein
MKKYSNEEILKVMKEAPEPVQRIIEDVQTSFIIANFMQKYSLHIDQIGSLAELNRNLLLGLINPEEFLAELTATVKVPDAQAREIMAEINTKIFVPLRDEMRNAGKGPATAQPVTPVARPVAASVPTPAPVQPPAPKSVPAPTIINLIPNGSRPAAAVSVPTRSAPAIAPLPPKLSLPGVPAALKPAIRGVAPINAIQHPPLVPPLAREVPASAPKVVVPAAPTSYTTDPYREPVDEK